MPHHCYRTAAIPQQRAAALRRSPGGAAEGAPAETQVAALRFRCEARAPGCLHVVLEAVSPRAPYLLENRSGQALQYRQSGLPDLPPLRAARRTAPPASPGRPTSPAAACPG